MSDTWYNTSNNSIDTRDPMGSTVAYTARNVGYTGGVDDVPDCYTVRSADGTPAYATISATSGGPGVGVITIELPAGYYAGGGYRHASTVVRPVTQTDVARLGGLVTNIDADMADSAATYRPLAVWLW